jgi:hypothetical protein
MSSSSSVKMSLMHGADSAIDELRLLKDWREPLGAFYSVLLRFKVGWTDFFLVNKKKEIIRTLHFCAQID